MTDCKSEFDLRIIFLPRGYCNFRCVFCHEEGLAGIRQHRSALDLSPSDVYDLATLLQPLGLRGLTLSGGEPSLDLEHIVSFVDVLPRLPTAVITNGTRLERLVPYLLHFSDRQWWIKINLPSFRPDLFQRLTGQTSFLPGQILAKLSGVIAAGAKVSLSCVLCPGENDDSRSLRSYLATASRHGVPSVRFLLQPNATVDDEAMLKARLRLGKPTRLRGGRIQRFADGGDLEIDIVRCERGPDEVVGEGVRDIFLTTRRTVKRGLWGREQHFSDRSQLRGIVEDLLTAPEAHRAITRASALPSAKP